MHLLPLLLAGMHRNRLGVLDRISRDIGPVARMPGLGVVFICDAGAAHEALQDTISFPDKGIGLSEARHYLGDGRLTATGSEWITSHRRASSFYTASAMARSVAAVVPALKRQLNGIDANPIALQPLIDRAIFVSVMAPLLGEERAFAIDSRPILNDLQVLAAWSDRQLGMRPPGVAHLSWLLSGRTRQAYARLGAAIDDWRRSAGPGTLAELSGLDGTSARTETLTLLVAGFETSSATAAFAVEAISRSPRWAAAIADGGGNLPIARQAVLETLRLYPPVWAITRRADRATTIAGHKIRSGDRLLINVHGLHRDPEVWDKPLHFDPDRFADGAPPASFLPFGSGPRQCVGRQAGVGEVAALVAWLFGRYHVEPVGPPVGIQAGLTQRPSQPGRYLLTCR